jgi:hypothetical protein
MMMPGREFNSDQMSNSFNGQLKSSEVGKNHYTALYWEYSSPTVRRWNMDPKPNISISPYAVMANNPIWNNDPLGDSLGVKFIKIGEKESYSERAFKALLGTKEGYNYLSKFAAKGQNLYGVTFKKDGEYHKKGIDLTYSNFPIIEDEVLNGSVYNGPRGETVDNLNGNRIKINVKLNYFFRDNLTDEFKKDYDVATKNGSIKKIDNILLLQRVQTLTHETFIHVNYIVMDFLKIPYKKYELMGYNTHHWTEHMKRLNNVGYEKTLFNNEGFQLMQRLNDKKNTGWDGNRIISSMYQFQY